MSDSLSERKAEHNRVYIIDSTLMMYRYFRGLPAMSANGRRTEAVYGFGKMLMTLMTKQPGAVVAVFDHGVHNFRNYVVPSYKEDYEAMPAELGTQIELAKQMCQILGVEVYNVNEVEADDVIASLSKKVQSGGKEAIVVSTDRDFFQLLDKGIKVLVPAAENQGLGEAPVLYDEETVREWMKEKFHLQYRPGSKERIGFDPKLVSDVKAIAGHTHKGVPGVKGIGEIGAAKLVMQYGNVEKIIKAIPSMPSGKGSVKEKLEAGLVNLIKSKEMTTLRTNVRLNQFKIENTEELRTFDGLVADTFFQTLGLKDLAKKSRKLAEQIMTAKATGHYDVGTAKTEPLFV